MDLMRLRVFPTTIKAGHKAQYLDSLNTFTDEYIKSSKDDYFEKYPNQETSFGGSYHSTTLLDDPRFDDYHTMIKNQSITMLDELGYDTKPYDITFSDSWVQEFSELGGGHHDYHTHANSTILAFYFLKCGPNCPKITFKDPRVARLPLGLKESNKDSITEASETINITPQEGLLVIAPGYLDHAFEVQSDSEPFRFIHSNIFFVPDSLKII